ncbi:MAG TPA: hypothetical protein VKO38_03340 [Wenzhouxiangella sp.]|nr:hypothetical protein [Wenzhouxiangella sp.]
MSELTMLVQIDEDQETTVSRLVAHLWFACRLKAGRDRLRSRMS